jgi:uncharacterized protein
MENLILILSVGFMCGIFTGYFGIGGGVILTPILNILGLPIIDAIGTVFLSIAINSLFGIYQHFKQKNVNLKVGISLGLSSIGGVELGKRFILFLDRMNLAGTSIRVIYIIFLSLISTLMLMEYIPYKKENLNKKIKKIFKKNKINIFDNWLLKLHLSPKISVPFPGKNSIPLLLLLVVGFFIGILSGILGVGGGFICLPFLIYVIKAPAIIAVGTSLVIVFFTSSFGAVTYAFTGHVEWKVAVFIIIGSFLGIHLGIKATKNCADKKIKIMFAIMLIGIAVSVFLKQVGRYVLGSYLVIIMAVVLCFAIIKPICHNYITKR